MSETAPLKLKNNPDSTDLTEAIKEYTIPSTHAEDGVRVPVSPVTLVDATREPIRQYSAFNWDSIPVTTILGVDPAIEVSPDNIAYACVVPAGSRWRVQAALMTLVCSADAANRSMFLRIYNAAGDQVYVTAAGVVITAGQTNTQTWVRNSLITVAATQYGMHIPDLELPVGWRVQVAVNNFDAVAAGDNATALTLYVKVIPV